MELCKRYQNKTFIDSTRMFWSAHMQLELYTNMVWVGQTHRGFTCVAAGTCSSVVLPAEAANNIRLQVLLLSALQLSSSQSGENVKRTRVHKLTQKKVRAFDLNFPVQKINDFEKDGLESNQTFEMEVEKDFLTWTVSVLLQLLFLDLFPQNAYCSSLLNDFFWCCQAS